MEVAALTTTSIYESETVATAEVVPTESLIAPISSDSDELCFQLGLWLSGLESFLNIRNHWFIEENINKAGSRDWIKEFRLTQSTLILCSRLAAQLAKVLGEANSTAADTLDLIDELDLPFAEADVATNDILGLSRTLRDAILLNDGMLRAAPLKFGEWSAWSNTLADKLESSAIVSKLIVRAEKTGELYLPEVLTAMIESKPLAFATESDLRLVLPRFARILKWLSVVEKMLRSDEPLKPSLLIFARIYEQIQELTGYINNRLQRFPNEEDELFGQLDGAAYTASIELRKVYNFELAGLAEMRSTPLIYAKIETAFSLLNDSFQLTLINFAQMIDPAIEPHRIFPQMREKLQQSLDLRRSLWMLLASVKAAEADPEKFPMKTLHAQLSDFLRKSVNLLFYKDRETVERFIEEVLVTRGKQDLVPILHRFGAYVETLFGQINMRVVLAAHPFDYDKGQ